MKQQSIKLNTGQEIPQVGLGLWQVKDSQKFNAIIDTAIEAGYRHFDSAQAYGNENLLGKAWQQSGIDRQDIFITTKISVTHFGSALTKKSFETSLKKLKTDYVDLLLLHFPVTGLRKSSWQELERIHTSGKARSIGVSNYTVKHLEQLKDYATIVPAVNQVELHVFLQQPELRDYCRNNGIVIEAYSPLAHAKDMDEPVIIKIAAKHGKSYAQIMLRWCLQQDLVVLPKSVTPERIKSNIDIFDFNLDEADMAELAKLNRGLRTCWDPTNIP